MQKGAEISILKLSSKARKLDKVKSVGVNMSMLDFCLHNYDEDFSLR